MVTIENVVYVQITREQFSVCVDSAKSVLQHLTDRPDLHKRDDFERFINILMGEVAETLVLQWLRDNGKTAYSAVDKTSGKPDRGHDLVLVGSRQQEITCSIKSSLSYKLSIGEILRQSKLATKESELRNVNIQVYFWLTLNPAEGEPRITVPALRQSCLVGWFGRKDITKFTAYNHEQRQAPAVPLSQSRPMHTLLPLLS